MGEIMLKIPAVVISLLLQVCICNAADYGKYEQPDANGISQPGPDNSQIRYVTDPHASIAVAGVSGGDYRLKTTREAQVDLIRYKDWFFHFGIQETSLFDYQPSQLDHQLYYFKIGQETDKGRISVYWDHTCNNPIRKFHDGKFNQIHWNEFGIGYETTGMQLGHENDGITFDDSSRWLNKIDYGAAFSWIWMRNDNDYKYMFKPEIRDDIVRFGPHVLYAQCKVIATYDDRGINYITSVEAGDRINLGRGTYLAPYVSYEYFHDCYGLDDGQDFYEAGLRLEASFGPDNSPALPKNNFDYSGTSNKSLYSPLRYYVNGGYNQNLHGTKNRCNSSDMFFDLDVLKFDDNKILTVNSYAGLLSERGSFDLQNMNYKIGPSLKIDLADSYLRFFHSYSVLYGDDFEGLVKKYNLFGAEFGKVARLSWLFQTAVYPVTTNFDYYSHFLATTNYDFTTGQLITPYVNGSLKYLLGNNSVFGNAVETGFKLTGEQGKFVLYVRHEDSYDVFRFGKGEQLWLGFRIIFLNN